MKNPAARCRLSALRIKPMQVDRENHTIRQAALVTRGEALGHELWLDEEFLQQVVKAGNASPSGVKARFTHPGLSADGLGKLLGRYKNFTLDPSGIVRADLKFSPAASKAPGGDLEEYVFTLAEDDPESFGNSIVFTHDPIAEEEFSEKNQDEETEKFCSPDEENESDFPHARLAKLSAADVVDEPAANPSGFFSDGEEAAAKAEAALAYLFGVTKTADPEAFGGWTPDKVKGFVAAFLSRHGLSVSPIHAKGETEEEQAMADNKTVANASPPPVTFSEADVAQAAAAGKVQGGKESRERLQAICAKYPDKDFAVAGFLVEKNDAELASGWDKQQIAKLQDELAKTREELAKKPAVVVVEGAEPVQSSTEAKPEAGTDFLAKASAYAKEKGISKTEAMRIISRENPAEYRNYTASLLPKGGQR